VQAPVVFGSLRDNTATRINYVIIGAMALCSLMYIPVGVFGLVAFGSSTAGDVLLSFSATNAGALVGRLLMGIHVMLAYPINSHPARLALGSLFFGVQNVRGHRFWGLTVGLFLCILIVATWVPGVNIVFGLLGSTAAVLWIFLFPAGFLWVTAGKLSRQSRVEAVVMMIVGVILAVTGTAETIMSIVES